MKVLVYPHSMSLGGSQLNALELAAAVQELGHETVLFAQHGPLFRRAAELGLEVVVAPAPGRRPSPRIIRALLELIDRRQINVVHGYEWPPALECVAASRLRPQTRAIATVLSMAVAPFIPRHMPLLVGTEQIAATERTFGRSHVGLMEPPVDLESNRPGVDFGSRQFRDRWAIDTKSSTIVLVSRLAHQLKLEGILTAMDAIAILAGQRPIQLVIVGDGPAMQEVAQHAKRINRVTGCNTVVLTGALEDPRPAYSIADVALGMGGSALRAMAFGKPLIVQGEQGYWKLLDSSSLPEFLWQGWYGRGDGSNSQRALAAILTSLLDDTDLRTRLGTFGLRTVQDRFSLKHAAQVQAAFYQEYLDSPPMGSSFEDLAAASRFVRHHVARRAQRLLGHAAEDDFNARPLAEQTFAVRAGQGSA